MTETDRTAWIALYNYKALYVAGMHVARSSRAIANDFLIVSIMVSHLPVSISVVLVNQNQY